MLLTPELQKALRGKGVETFHPPNGVQFPDDAEFEPPCSIKWLGSPYGFRMGAFSYAVSGYLARVRIGRYCSMGEQLQLGRSNHPMTWVTTSPFLYTAEELFQVGADFPEAAEYHAYRSPPRRGSAGPPPGNIVIGNDVWIGHGAFVRPGVTIGDGAVIGAMSVVTRDVPPYAIVAGNPATVKRMRLPPAIAAQLLELKWWRFAPWQLSAVDFSLPEKAIDELRRVIETEKPYEPGFFKLGDLAAK